MKNIRKYIPYTLKRFLRKYIFPLPEIQNLSIKQREIKLKEFYKLKTGQELDLDNPQLFTEKLQWLKLYYKHPDLRRCVDKADFKDYVKEKLGGGYTAPIICIWDKPEQVSIRKIPAQKFVLKSTLQSDGNFIVLVKDKKEINIEQIEDEIKSKWFDTKLLLTNSFCSAYYGSKPRVIVEEFIEEFNGASNDYKLFCFQGEPEFFYVAEDHFKNGDNSVTYPITFFDLEWNVLNVKYGEHTTNPCIKKPKHCGEMIQLAKKLSADFPFVRVDFFDTEEKLYLAELTFYPGGGLTPYYPESFNYKMGEMLYLPQK